MSENLIPGLGKILSERALAKYTLEEIQADPYILMNVDGISFQRADAIAKNFGIAQDDVRRQRALLRKLVYDSCSFGHTYLPMRRFEILAKKEKLPFNENLIAESFTVDEDAIYLPHLYYYENYVAEDLARRSTITSPPLQPMGVSLEEIKTDRYQRLFIESFLVPHANVVVLTGGPGTGKTFVTKKLIQLLQANGVSFLCMAPTGKAAKRMAEVTGVPAHTVHKALGAPTWDKKISAPYVIIDETSMVDLPLAFRILKAARNSNIVFIGDADQLASVGPGSFFRDLIACKLFPTTRLLTNHRQGEGSSIADNAIRINIGAMQLYFDDDFRFIEISNPIEIRQKVIELSRKLLEEYGDFQILTPQKKTVIGTEELNKIAKMVFNPGKFKKFDVGDKVIQTANDYKRDIFNGYLGYIIDVKGQDYGVKGHDIVTVDFGDIITETTTMNLIHGWAVTVHKFQGSEFDVGIIILSSAHTFMLTRNLLYTAITRAKKKCLIVGDALALKRAIKNTREVERYSKLLARIREAKALKEEE